MSCQLFINCTNTYTNRNKKMGGGGSQRWTGS